MMIMMFSIRVPKEESNYAVDHVLLVGFSFHNANVCNTANEAAIIPPSYTWPRVFQRMLAN